MHEYWLLSSVREFIFTQLSDGTGTGSRLSIWSHPGNDVTGMVARCEKVARTSEKVSRFEVVQNFTTSV